MTVKSKLKELEAGSHITPAVMKKKDMNTYTQTLSHFYAARDPGLENSFTHTRQVLTQLG